MTRLAVRVSTASIFLALFCGGIAAAAVNEWTPLGPLDQTGSPIFCQSLAISPDGKTIYVGTDSAVYRSEDAGVHWKRFSVPTPGGIPKLLLSPETPSVVYAGTATGFFVSPDRGETWKASGLDGQAVYTLAIDPQSPTTLYAGAWLPVFPEKGVISRSRDGGVHWEQLFAEAYLGPVIALAIDPLDSSVLFAGTGDGGPLLRSIDEGATWSRVDQNHGQILSLLIDPISPSTIYASWGSGLSPGFFPPAGLVGKSLDGGDNWFDVPGLPRISVGRMVMDPRSPSVLSVEADNQLWRTLDAGGHWAPIAPAIYAQELLTDPSNPATLYGAGYGGVERLGSIPGPCKPDATSLCLLGGRFRVEAAWQLSPLGPIHIAQAVPVTSDSGYFWFFDPDNVELMVKVLDGTSVNGFFWVFYGALSNVGYTILVTDTLTGETKTYVNPPGKLASVADTAAFPGSASPHAAGIAQPAVAAPPASALAEKCLPDGVTLCLNGGRFRVEAAWQVSPLGPTVQAHAVPLTGDTGYFWFFDEANIELVVKVLDGTAINGHFWVFYGALSNVEYTISVTDTQTGAVMTYHNPRGTLASVADTTAF